MGLPSLFQMTLGSGCPTGGPQFKTATSPSATSTSLGCTANSSSSTTTTESGLPSISQHKLHGHENSTLNWQEILSKYLKLGVYPSARDEVKQNRMKIIITHIHLKTTLMSFESEALFDPQMGTILCHSSQMKVILQ